MTQQVYSDEIYHGLPDLSASPNNLTAIITGTNGLSGSHMLRRLCQNPERWSNIYCLSLHPPYGKHPDHVQHTAVDLLQSPETLAAILIAANVQAEYVFYFSHVQPPPKPGMGLWSDAGEVTRLNSLIFQNLLGGLAGARIIPRRILLQAGAKYYGGHLGPMKVPQVETDPRVDLEPNFYYSQEDSLVEYCAGGSGERRTRWNIILPGPLVGAAPRSAMNVAFPLAVYASICRKLNQSLEYPSDVVSWQMPLAMSSAGLNAHMEEWAVLTPGAADQRINQCDNSTFTWEGFWPCLAEWYGISWKGPEEDVEWIEFEMPYRPRGYGPKGVLRWKFTFGSWSQQPHVQQAWRALTDEHGLIKRELSDLSKEFAFLDGCVSLYTALLPSMNKARKLGWHGFVDTSDAFFQVFRELSALKMVPPMPLLGQK
ncbi:hypothetical protein COCMIDRAFT_108582 [Bipolaris oryzae ATCC 44560]|uniref:PRISE-like Rossmann-fold domain-containing protein n=1 Tax=Bipolaris oryzae ATCC 44560 TaxID=930090 RepID=W6Z9Y9_COCMI|nr:uncharacterized protein COCMIDRAFT_108582 [Bipolaris oryzae ATCC 44560]EUC40526.1 hypothetical protein COCMIDRAFT_108582 [Bipolaris oryzae ATCC 44560]